MKLLLDTHVILWLLAGDDRVPEWLRAAAEESDDELLVSDVSLWEIAIKSSLGRIEVPDSLPEVIDQSGVSRLEIAQTHIWKVRDLEFHHRDPFDRLLVAQALVEGLTVVSRDRDLAAYEAATRW
jgi:PIN domain nuclease of toxin-antitoxin system